MQCSVLDQCFILGWGAVNENITHVYARKLQFTMVKKVNCVGPNTNYTPKVISDAMFCAGEKNKDHCFGDSGGE